MNSISTLGMLPHRQRIFEAGLAFQARQQAADAARHAKDVVEAARLTRERRARIRRMNEEIRQHHVAEVIKVVRAIPDAISGVRVPREIIKRIADEHGLTPADLTGPCRSPKFVRARHEAMWAVKQATGLAINEIARRFGGRDHSTVIHAIRQHQARIDATAVRALGGESRP